MSELAIHWYGIAIACTIAHDLYLTLLLFVPLVSVLACLIVT